MKLVLNVPEQIVLNFQPVVNVLPEFMVSYLILGFVAWAVFTRKGFPQLEESGFSPAAIILTVFLWYPLVLLDSIDRNRESSETDANSSDETTTDGKNAKGDT